MVEEVEVEQGWGYWVCGMAWLEQAWDEAVDIDVVVVVDVRGVGIMGLGGEGYRWPNEGIRLVLVLVAEIGARVDELVGAGVIDSFETLQDQLK
jgi:hypothetical protein